MTKKKQIITKQRIEIRSRTFVYLFLILPALYLLFSAFYLERVYFGVYFAGIALSGKDKAQVFDVVSDKIKDFESKPVEIVVNDIGVDILLSDLGIYLDKKKTVDEIYRTGRSGKTADDLRHKFNAIFDRRETKPQYSVDFLKFENRFNSEFSKFEERAEDATIVFKNGVPAILDSKEGRTIDKSRLISDLKIYVETQSSQPITIFTIVEKPRVISQNAQRALARVQMLNSQRIVLNFGFDSWTLSESNLLSILQFTPSNFQNEQISINLLDPVTLSHATHVQGDSELEVSLNEPNLNDFIAEIVMSVDRKTVNATLRFENGKIVEFSPAQDGQSLDTVLTRKMILDKVSIENADSTGSIVLNLPVNVRRAKIANAEVNNLGIKELIGRGVSYYAGSIPNRIHNLTLGSNLISGTLVAPGDLFSFNALVGPVSSSQGFKQAYIIQSGRTVLDDGGGICQVSTTVFRAALNTGLPIVARTAHAYRVGYYEQKGFKPGLDATIFSPSVDLKFKNDTEHHILVQAIVDRTNSKLQVDIYGSSDGRRVEISEPVVTNQVPAPPPLYQDDPSIPKGVVKQVDFAAAGATSVFKRKVYKGDQVLIDELFKSNFRPWQAVYLVGTG
jgi:vancomycin resistance protein YoaR